MASLGEPANKPDKRKRNPGQEGSRKRKRIDYMAIANQLPGPEDALAQIRRRESLDSYARLQSLIGENDLHSQGAQPEPTTSERPAESPPETDHFDNSGFDFANGHTNSVEQFSLPSWKEIEVPGHVDDVVLPDSPEIATDTLEGGMLESGHESDSDDLEELLQRLQELDRVDEEHEGRKAVADYLCDEAAINTLRIIGWKLRNHASRESYNDLRETLTGTLDFDSEFKALKLLHNLSGLNAIIYHCCVNSCIAYTGQYTNLKTCPFCQEPRFSNDNKTPRSKFSYIPLIPRLRAVFADMTYRDLCMYRGNHKFNSESTTDYCDGYHYRTLLNRAVEIIHEDGQREVLQHRHFSDARDIALGLFSDGFQLFKKSRVQKSAMPLLLVNLNLPPTIRTHLEHLICLGIAPGPHSPKDANSYFHPAYLELQELARGVKTRDARLNEDFKLHAYLVFKCGDLPAVAKFLEQKGHNGVSPCSACEATGVRVLAIGNGSKASKNYYFPLRPPLDHPEPRGPIWDPANLPMRTDMRIKAQLSEIESASTQGLQDTLAKKYGLNGRSLLSCLSSISIASTPRDVMHLLFEHMVPMLISFWKGEYKPWKSKKLDHGQPYVIPEAEWIKIGLLTVESSLTIPGSFTRALPNIHKEGHLYIAETYAFWMMYLAPIVLKGRWRDTDKYYRHAILLSNILRRLVEYEIPNQDVSPSGSLAQDIILFVQQYYDYYYQYKNERLAACNSTPHGMLHLANDIQTHGPSWVYWCFVMERFCGSLLPDIGSRSNPYPSLTKRTIEAAQISLVKKLYPDLKKVLERKSENLLSENSEDRERINTHERLYAEFPHTVLCRPYHQNVALDRELQDKLETHFKILFSTPQKRLTAEDVRPYVSRAQMDRCGKVRRAFGGDTIQSAMGMDKKEKARDTSFVRACFTETVEGVDRRVIYYGQVECFWVCHFLPSPWTSNETRYILALFSPCGNTRGVDATKKILTYKTLNRSKFVAVTTIESVVGRVQTEPGRREWAIIDRSGAYASTVLTDRGLPDVE